MGRNNALLLVLAIVTLAAFARLLPYTPRLLGYDTTAPTVASAPLVARAPVSLRSPSTIPSRLGERPLTLVAAGLLAELGLLGFILYSLARSSHVGTTFAALAGYRRNLAAILLVCTGVGFVAGVPEWTFPFIPWRMFSGAPAGEPVVDWVVGTTEDGRRVRIDLVSALAGLGHTRGREAVLDRIAAVVAADASQPASRRLELDNLLQAVARLHTRHTGVGLVRIGVTRHVMNAARPLTMSQLSLDPTWETQVRP